MINWTFFISLGIDRWEMFVITVKHREMSSEVDHEIIERIGFISEHEFLLSFDCWEKRKERRRLDLIDSILSLFSTGNDKIWSRKTHYFPHSNWSTPVSYRLEENNRKMQIESILRVRHDCSRPRLHWWPIIWFEFIWTRNGAYWCIEMTLINKNRHRRRKKI